MMKNEGKILMFRVLTKALIFKDNKLLMLKRKLGSSFAGGTWDIPGGKMEFGEQPENALVREVYEETSLKIEILDILSISSGVNKVKRNQYITIVYICNYVSGSVSINSENIDYEWVDADKADKHEKIYYLKEAIEKYKEKYNN
jgi:8-oxo-dGTP diphosphatase